MSSDRDDEFSPKESADKTDDEKFLNKKTGEYIPKAVTKTFLFISVAIGFAIGFIAAAAVTSGTICLFQTISTLTADPTAVEAQEDLTENVKSDYIQCTRGSITSPVSIIVGIVGGVIGAYPGYKLVKSMSGQNYLRSII
jgi:hypothetical protein